jgi:hypothetical protein
MLIARRTAQLNSDVAYLEQLERFARRQFSAVDQQLGHIEMSCFHTGGGPGVYPFLGEAPE